MENIEAFLRLTAEKEADAKSRLQVGPAVKIKSTLLKKRLNSHNCYKAPFNKTTGTRIDKDIKAREGSEAGISEVQEASGVFVCR